MARMIDPSELEGAELVDWYQRSPADVEAEREAARQDRYDAFVKSIGAAAEPQDDPAVEPPAATYDAGQDSPNSWGAGEIGSGDDDAGLIQARYFRPTMPPVMPPPSGFQVGPSVDARGAAPVGAPASGFFGRHDYSTALGGYYTDLPSPLDFVTSTPAGWWEIGDGSRVQASEVERIYAEQQRRRKGQDKAEPAARIRAVDRLQDGYVPRVDQVAKDERELDPTCHPNGGWERDPGFDKYPELAKRYETQIARAPGLDYVVRNPGQKAVRFDGCAVWEPQHPLLEAKGPRYASLIAKARKSTFLEDMLTGDADQAYRQAKAAPHQRVEWHVAEPGAYAYFNDATRAAQPPIVVQVTPPR